MKLDELAELLALPDLLRTMEDVESLMADLVRSADAELAEPCLRLLQESGKRLRPVLVVAAAACGRQGLDATSVLAGAAAVELMHNGSLVHDDIMDDAASRRGVPSINFQEGPGTALLCGDLLFALSNYAAAQVSRDAAFEAARTIVSLCNGQSRELIDSFDPARTPESILRSVEGKTSALLATSCRIGGMCGGLAPPLVDALGAYGYAFGMSFQLVDDVLDFVSNEAVSGKPVLNDLRCGVYTMPVALALMGDSGRELYEALDLDGEPTARGAGAHGRFLSDPRVAAAVDILRAGDYLPRVVDIALGYAGDAARHLAPLADEPTARGLAQLPRRYVELQLQRAEPSLLPLGAATT